MRLRLVLVTLLLGVAAGCGTTRWTDTARTATEQLLISDAMDRAISRIDLRALAGRKVYLDTAPVSQATDSAYLISTLRQHMLASGCIIKEKREDADYVVEIRAGAIGTDKRELMFGVPAVTVPTTGVATAVPSSIPEIPFVKRTEQRAVTKIALFAFSTKTGRPVWQSGCVPVESTARDIWVFGAGPFQRGTIYGGTRLAGDNLNVPLVPSNKKSEEGLDDVAVADEAFFNESSDALAPKAASSTPSHPAADKEKEKSKPDEKAAVAEAKAEPPKNPPGPVQDSQVVPANHAPTSVETKSASPSLVVPWPVESPPAAEPRLIESPNGATPLPKDLYPILGIPAPSDASATTGTTTGN